MNKISEQEKYQEVISGATYLLPSITSETLSTYITGKVTEESAGLAALLYAKIIDRDILPRLDLKQAEAVGLPLIKDNSILGYKDTPINGEKKKATANTLSVLLSQEIFSKTGTVVRLPHSGFTVVLKPITSKDVLDLQYRIAENVIGLYRALMTDMHTGIYVTIYEELLRLFISKIEYTTLALDKKDKIVKYIRVKDLGMIIAVLSDMIQFDGYDYQRVCATRSKDENNVETTCTNLEDKRKMKVKEMIYLADDLTPKEQEQLMLNTANAIKIDQALEYQKNFKYNQPDTIKLGELTFTIDTGSISNFFNKCRKWLDTCVLNVPAFTTGHEVEVLTKIIDMTKLGMYYYAIDKIENDRYESDDSPLTIDHITILSSNKQVMESLIEAVDNHLHNSFYQIGIPKYTCPTCKANANKIISEVPEQELETQIDRIGEPEIDNISIDGLENKIDIKTSATKADNNDLIFTNISLLDLFTFLVYK